jgi:hypothetical protein
MRSPVSLAMFTASMLLALVLVVVGLVLVFTPSGSTLLGLVLIVAAFGLSGYARNARAGHLHRQKMAGMWQWAQGLGPRSKKGGRRAW